MEYVWIVKIMKELKVKESNVHQIHVLTGKNFFKMEHVKSVIILKDHKMMGKVAGQINVLKNKN